MRNTPVPLTINLPWSNRTVSPLGQVQRPETFVRWQSPGDGRIDGIQAKVEGSALAVACSSLMGCAVKGIPVEEALALAKSVIEFLENDKEVSLPGDLVVYESIVRFPERHDCALLAWRALLLALNS